MPERFGRYELIERLARGGMGEVFLARLSGAAGFEKAFVIKRVLPHLADDLAFRDLFLDEARIAARLSHPNIVQIFELGDVDGQWFIVMEYVAGKDLRTVQAQVRSTGGLPFELSCRIVADAAAALAFAHQAHDPQGRPMHVVHRDVTPHNLLVGFDGVVKLIDFGVARAANRLQHSEVGVLRGKYGYMSPEQVLDEGVDGRSDQFSLGVVFWELLVGQRLFRADNDAVTLERVAECRVMAPRDLDANVPEALEATVLRMLEKDPADRFPDCGAARQALEDWLRATRAEGTPAHLSRWMRATFPMGPTPLEPSAAGARTTSSPSRSRPPAAEASGPDDVTLALLKQVVGARPPLPAEGTSFVGRAHELKTLAGWLEADARLVTLVGPGGVGKTRLAMQLAQRARLPAYFAALPEVVEADALCLAVSRALGHVTVPGDAPDLAAGRLLEGKGRCLLVLDNFEQLLAHVDVVQRWRAQAPQATVLVTSREALKLEGERRFEVPPLAEAAALFLERAKAARPGWAPTPADLSAVDELVKSLDGLPLAIELAAARMTLLTPAQLMQRLPRRLDLLADASGSASPRQATLRGALDWSWALLEPHEQLALAQLGVFRGGFSLEAVEAVLDLSAFPQAPWPLDVVQALKDKSLVRGAEGHRGEVRFSLLESMHAWALEKLGQLPPEVAAATRARHTTFFLSLGAERAAELEGPGAIAAIDRLELDRDNFFAVFHRAVEAAPTTQTARVAVEASLSVDPLLLIRGPVAAHLAMLNTSVALADAQHLDDELRARGLLALGEALRATGKLTEAVPVLERAARLAGSSRGSGRALHSLAAALRQQGAMEEAQRTYERALGLLRQAGDRWTEGRVLGHLGGLSQEMGAVDAAKQFYERALKVHVEVGDRRFEGIVLGNLAAWHQEKALTDDAQRLYTRALAIHREVGNRRSEAIALSNLASVPLARADLPFAAELLTRAIGLHREVGNLRFEGIALYHLAMISLANLQPLEAERGLGQALALLRKVADRRYLAAVLAGRASALAGLGRLAEGQASLDEARQQLEDVTDAHSLAVLDVARGHLELARGQPALAVARLEAVKRPTALLPSPFSQSDNVRLAALCLEKALARASAHEP